MLPAWYRGLNVHRHRGRSVRRRRKLPGIARETRPARVEGSLSVSLSSSPFVEFFEAFNRMTMLCAEKFLSAFPLDLFGFDLYTFPSGSAGRSLSCSTRLRVLQLLDACD